MRDSEFGIRNCENKRSKRDRSVSSSTRSGLVFAGRGGRVFSPVAPTIGRRSRILQNRSILVGQTETPTAEDMRGADRRALREAPLRCGAGVGTDRRATVGRLYGRGPGNPRRERSLDRSTDHAHGEQRRAGGSCRGWRPRQPCVFWFPVFRAAEGVGPYG